MNVGDKVWQLTYLGPDENKKGYGIFQCDCGTVKSIKVYNVENKMVKSCGCYGIKHPAHFKHGLSHTPIDNVYKSMVSRCYNEHNNRYKNYGERGIRICDEWLNDKQAFFTWAHNSGYQKGYTIDRIDVNKGYSPENCRWATYQEQANNKTSNHYITYNGKTQTMTEWSRECGIKTGTLFYRLKCGWSIEDALNKPVNR